MILLMAITLDGMIGRDSEHLSLDWTCKEDKKLFVSMTKEAGVMIMGRKTYATIGRPLPGRLIKVMTHDTSKFESIPDQVEFTDRSPEEIAKELESRGFEKCILAGGATINGLFLNTGLIDEVVVTVEPKIFGQGVPLFNGVVQDADLELLDSQMLNANTIKLHYQVVR